MTWWHSPFIYIAFTNGGAITIAALFLVMYIIQARYWFYKGKWHKKGGIKNALRSFKKKH